VFPKQVTAMLLSALWDSSHASVLWTYPAFIWRVHVLHVRWRRGYTVSEAS